MLNILCYPDERLRTVAKIVNKVDLKIQHIIDDMINTMYVKKGIGLAATQVNIHYRIIVIDISEFYEKSIVLVNPELLYKSGKTGMKEGCLSIPNQYGYVSRYEKIKVRALNYYGKFFDIEANGILAICIQHEMDHLVGKMFIDYLSPLKRKNIIEKIKNK